MVNRLAAETSPYLLQHKDNPVEWWPWSEEALATAKAQDKPILLSVGYAACHWCHVMAHESFEDVATADLMNEHFVCIKVDREERPDIDALYMDAVQAMTGQGGWPMTVFLTPDGEPFYGGTYFPPADRHGLPAFAKLLAAIADTWANRRDEVTRQSKRLSEYVGTAVRIAISDEPITARFLDSAAEELGRSFDPLHGGFSGAPKFPQPMLVDLCARLSARGHTELDAMSSQTLDPMAAGGMFDQLGGGFHRYSVDRSWTVPHFEKMLYDNAQLIRTYARSWQRTRAERHRAVALATGEWMLAEMQDAEGGFYSSLDADSEGAEGRYYVWDLDEATTLLGELSEVAIGRWGFSVEGNFEGANIPVLASDEGDPDSVEKAAAALLAARARRARPNTDTKVLAAWNGLAGAGLAEAGWILDRPDWIAAAAQAVSFVFERMRPGGRLMRSFGRDANGSERVGPPGFCDDYASLLEGSLSLFEATGDISWLRRARWTADAAIELFWDSDEGGFFATGADQEQLIVRKKELIDNAVPAANSVMALELQRLASFTGDDSYEARAVQTIRLVLSTVERAPLAFGNLLAAIDYYTSDPKEIVIVAADDAGEVLDAVRTAYLPNRVIVQVDRERVGGLQEEIPLVHGRSTIGNATTVYVCKRGVCDLPVTGSVAVAERLKAG
ncbi:MAG: uncharacterized protein QOF16_1165 [Actinomycetota bacterium]|nr:uncharacterized protein [Actinomycetota bacterium]